MGKNQRIQDPLHNLIEFDSNEFESALWRVVQTRPFQRLRRIKQLGFSDLVYPGATHSRFAHSVGVFHTARILMNVIRTHLGERDYKQTRAQAALAASLVHDLGHGPFSHAFEEVGKRLNFRLARHELISDKLIRDGEVATALKSLGSGFHNDVADIVGGERPENLYAAVVSSQFDADRLDYMRRDRLMAGTQTGGIDFDWLVANLEVGQVPYGVDDKPVGAVDTFVLGPKAIHAAEAYVVSLFQLYPTLYLHKATRGAEKIFTELLFRVISLIIDGSVRHTGLPDNHPIVRFAAEPDVIENIQNLDDTVVWGALSMLRDAQNSIVADFSKRLQERKLFKCIDVRARVRDLLKGQDGGEHKLEAECAKIEERITEWQLSEDIERKRLLVDKTKREPYRQFQESKGPLNQIRIRTSSQQSELIDIVERSEVVAAIKTFHALRVYVDEDDVAARSFVDGLLKGAKP